MTRLLAASAALLVVLSNSPSALQTPSASRRNVILFVADGLRHDSVNERDTPALWKVRTQGVHFVNSHSVFPTFTTPNASAIATGHQLGDTGDFSNTIWAGYATFDTGNLGKAGGTPVPFIENDQILADLNAHFGANYLGEDTLLSLARASGYNTAAIGKEGPTAIQAIDEVVPAAGGMLMPPSTLVVDDATGTPGGVPLPPELVYEMRFKLQIPPEAPGRSNGYGATSQYNNGNPGTLANAGTLAANTVQQQWMMRMTTEVVLPRFLAESKPFAIVYWSRDPDATQHNQGDSLGVLGPGINGPSSILGAQNADRNLQELLDWLDAHPEVKANTDLFVTSDHGFATISRREIDPTGKPVASVSAKHVYVDGSGNRDTPIDGLPSGFLAVDLAHDLQAGLFDPAQRLYESSQPAFRKLRVDMSTDLDSGLWQHPVQGNGLLGPTVNKADGSDAKIIVAANGGSDLIYLPDGSRDMLQLVIARLLRYEYVSGLFVDDKYGSIPGTLPLSAINLVGSSRLVRPTLVVAFKVFYFDPENLHSAVQISDTVLQEGQGMHGGFGRESTWNNMAAIGPDFKAGFVDQAPAGNVDIMPTIARILGLQMKPRGSLTGRVLREALRDEAVPPPVKIMRQVSAPAAGRATVLLYQEFDHVRYLDTACSATPEESATTTCR
jgi:arylsulfatase A-like enzyme